MPEKEVISAIVKSEKKTGKNGQYEVKYILKDDRQYSVSKGDFSKVEAGKEYTFELATSEYNNKTYYWANLKQQTSKPDISGEDVKSYFNNIDKDKQHNMIKWMIDNLKG